MKKLNEQNIKECFSQQFLLSESNQQSIKQADVLQNTSMFKQISFNSSVSDDDIVNGYNTGKNGEEQIQQLIGNNRSSSTSIIQLSSVGQNIEKEASSKMMIPKSKSSKQGEVLKKINMDKIIKNTIGNKIQKTILKLSGKKKKPNQDNQLELMWQKNQNRTHRQIMKNCKTSAIKHFRKDKYIKKNYQFQMIITKICDLKTDQKICSIKGQILFKWEKQVINQKWAKTDMVCIEINDGTDSVIVAIPEKILMKKVWELEIGMWVQLYRVQPKQKYPKKICMLVTQNSQIKIYTRSQISPELISQPQKFGITLKQLELQPIGRICNIVCIIIQKSQKQFIKSYKGTSLVISKITIYDPIDNRIEYIKLWEEKSDLTFYRNGTVYLLRGIQIKEFKGFREYQACKDFNYRVLTYSSIQMHLRELYEERWGMLNSQPGSYHKMRIDECCHILERKYVQLMKKQRVVNSKQGSSTEQLTLKDETKKSQSVSITKNDIKNHENMSKRVVMVWSQCIIKFINFEIEQNYQIRYIYCLECRHKTMMSCLSSDKCTVCNSVKCLNIYFIKCQFSDGRFNYLGEMNERAASKIFAVENQMTKMQFFQQCHINFKRSIVKEVINVAVRAIIASTKQRISDEVWVYGHYIVDVLPFDDMISQEGEEREDEDIDTNKNEVIEGKEKDEISNESQENKIVRFLK